MAKRSEEDGESGMDFVPCEKEGHSGRAWEAEGEKMGHLRGECEGEIRMGIEGRGVWVLLKKALFQKRGSFGQYFDHY